MIGRRTCDAAFTCPDPALAQALPVPVGHSDPVTVRTSRPPGHAPTLLGWAQWKAARAAAFMFESVPLRIFLQGFHQQILHALVGFAEETVGGMSCRRLVLRQTFRHIDQHGVSVVLVEA